MIIACLQILLWFIEALGEFANSDGIVGTIACAIILIVPILLFAKFILSKKQIKPSEKDSIKNQMLDEKIRNEVKRSHPMN